MDSDLTARAPASVTRQRNYGGFQAPDVVANLRVDQAWGSAQIMGALHQVNATYYTAPADHWQPVSGHPDDKLGLVVGAGIKLNAPMIGQGDYLQAQVNYTEGALAVYLPDQPTDLVDQRQRVQRSASVPIADAVYDGVLGGTGTSAATDLELTTAWGVNAAYEHFWNPRWRTSLYGGYAAVSYGSGCEQHRAAASAPAATRHQRLRSSIGRPGGSVRAPSGTSPRTSTWVWT